MKKIYESVETKIIDLSKDIVTTSPPAGGENEMPVLPLSIENPFG